MKSIHDIGLSDVKSVLHKKNYEIFTSEGVPNIVGIRNSAIQSNYYNDICWVFWIENRNEVAHFYSITTHPGYYYLKNPIKGTKGTAILVPGQYFECWLLGMHRGTQFALCQRGGMVRVYRDNNKDTVLDFKPETIDLGFFGIDLHHGSLSNSEIIDKWSAGCQVWQYNEPHNELMQDFKRLSRQHGFSRFTYTLLNQEDFI